MSYALNLTCDCCRKVQIDVWQASDIEKLPDLANFPRMGFDDLRELAAKKGWKHVPSEMDFLFDQDNAGQDYCPACPLPEK